MNRLICKIAGVMILGMLLAAALPFQTKAAEEKTYTVTFRAGNTGTFLTQQIGTGEHIKAGETYITYTVKRGESLESSQFFSGDTELNSFLANVTSVKDGYFLKDISQWGAGIAQREIKRNEEYVLDYGKLTAPVKYGIYFVDAQSGLQIATPTIAYQEEGQVITSSPLQIEGYETEEGAQSLTLKKGTNNRITFSYTQSRTAETVTNTIINYVPGNVIYQDELVTVPAVQTAGTVNQGGVTPGQEGETDVDGAGVDEADADRAGVDEADADGADADGAGGGNADGADADGADGMPGETNGADVDGQEVIIEDPDVPLAAVEESNGKSWSWVPVFAAAGGVIVAGAGAAVVIARRKKLKK